MAGPARRGEPLTDSQRELLRRYGIRPTRRRGQNFLVDPNLARSIAGEVTALGPDVLELGAGAGALTGPLLEMGAAVTAVEVDRGLCELLRQELGGSPRFRLLEADLSRLDWEATLRAVGARPVVAGNLPYLLTSTVLFALADHRLLVAGAVLMVQREVADRMTAAPGSGDYGVLGALLGSVFATRTVRKVPPEVFWPRPEVASAVVQLLPDPAAAWGPGEYERFRETVKTLFGRRRKKVATILRGAWKLERARAEAVLRAAGVDPDARPEALSPARLRALAEALAGRGTA